MEAGEAVAGAAVEVEGAAAVECAAVAEELEAAARGPVADDQSLAHGLAVARAPVVAADSEAELPAVAGDPEGLEVERDPRNCRLEATSREIGRA